MGWVVTPLGSATFLDDQATSMARHKKLPHGQCHDGKNVEQDMKSSFVTEDSCTQHNCQQFEDPHNSLQQGLASVQQGLPNYVCVNGCMQSACAYHT